MSNIQGWFILVIGIGFAAVAIQGVFRGWLPNGPKGFQQGEGVSRESSPIGFWFFFILYIGVSGYAVVYALRLLSGDPTP